MCVRYAINHREAKFKLFWMLSRAYRMLMSEKRPNKRTIF